MLRQKLLQFLLCNDTLTVEQKVFYFNQTHQLRKSNFKFNTLLTFCHIKRKYLLTTNKILNIYNSLFIQFLEIQRKPPKKKEKPLKQVCVKKQLFLKQNDTNKINRMIYHHLFIQTMYTSFIVFIILECILNPKSKLYVRSQINTSIARTMNMVHKLYTQNMPSKFIDQSFILQTFKRMRPEENKKKKRGQGGLANAPNTLVLNSSINHQSYSFSQGHILKKTKKRGFKRDGQMPPIPYF
eukprot:TRINITY_DN43006_c1_g1_i6.p1 TRINITY_DN43006_c1_g1~~TRINITY_DN43006_c1_g1_i6.p1  ORF type:complete len:240 (+),score=-1.73 TRINITY_DN43006_c1_g1_i6:356-1075(+)